MEKIKIVIIDDSAAMRSLLRRMIGQDPTLEVVGEAADPYEAREVIKKTNPDVITLDIEMPKMDGISMLRKIMSLRPTPVIMISTLTEKGAEVTLEALEIGAVDCICKPKSIQEIERYKGEILGKLKAAAKANLSQEIVIEDRKPVQKILKESPTIKRPFSHLLAIGASTGGVDALGKVLVDFDPLCPPIVITQHIPIGFSQSLSQHLNDRCQIKVSQALDGEMLESGHAYIAPGDRHMEVIKSLQGYMIKLSDGPTVKGHKPSVDKLFFSVAKEFKEHAIAALLTGMGEDGAEGLLAISQAGGLTIAQDQATSLIWGMPGTAVRLGAAKKIIPLKQVCREMMLAASKVGAYGK